MKILNVVSVISRKDGGGNAERTIQLSRALTELGNTCEILSLNNGNITKDEFKLPFVSITLIPCISKRFHIPFPAFSIIKDSVKRADVIHLIGHWSFLNAMVRVIAIKEKTPYVVSPAGALKLFGRSKWLKFLFNYFFGKRILRDANGYIAITKGEFQDFEEYGISKEKLIVIPNGIFESDFDNNIPSNTVNLKRNNSSRIILFMGRLNFIKGPDLLLESFSHISALFPDVVLVFFGTDEGMSSTLIQRAISLGIDDKVFLMGFADSIMKIEAYRNACILVVPSRREAMSLVAVEAGACGLPVLMTDQCGLDEICEVDSRLMVSATVEGLKQGLIFALENQERLLLLGKKWQIIVQSRFTWRRLSQELASVYEKIISMQRK